MGMASLPHPSPINSTEFLLWGEWGTPIFFFFFFKCQFRFDAE